FSFFNYTATTWIYILSLHDALPISFGFNNSGFNYTSSGEVIVPIGGIGTMAGGNVRIDSGRDITSFGPIVGAFGKQAGDVTLNRSEEHTSELQSRENLVCRLLLEKK